MRKRIIVIALCMLIATLCLCAMPAPALADGTVASADTTWDGGTWSVTSDVELTNRVAVQGEVTLVLGAGTTLTAPQGITVNDGNTLTITGEGTLEATGPTHEEQYGLAGIGSSPDAAAGTIVIQGGTIIARGGQSSGGTSGAAGIGGSTTQGKAYPSGTIRIEGGTVEAYGGGNSEQGGAGIGGENGCGANVTITGGTVHATGGSAAAAIGAGNDAGNNECPNVNIAIDGGTVDVGAGTIGGDYHAGNVTVAITGGQVTGIIGASSFASVENVTYAATVALAWSSVDDFVDARYPNATVTFNKGFRKADDADKALVSADEAMGFSDQTKIVPRMVVSFEPNGGTPAPPDYVADDGGKVAKPDDPALDGCRFDGWYLDQDLTQPFSFDSDTVDKDCTLYAKWTTLHTVTFNSNGGTAVESQVVGHGKSAVRPSDPTREGCTFEGWYEDEGLSTAYDFAKAVEADLTLYAKWLPTNTPKPTMSTSAGGSFVARTTEVTYTVSQKVASDATSLTIAVNLEPVLALSSSSVSVGLDGGGAIEAASSIEGQKLSVSVPQAADLRGKTILVTYKAKVRDGADLSSYTNSAGTTASIPYQARTTFVGATTREVASDVESVKVALGSGSSSSGSTSAGSTSTTASTLPRTSEPNTGAMAAALAVGGACLAMVGTRSRRHVG